MRFALGFSVLFTVLLATALILIYISFANFRKDEFYNRLRDKALTTFRLLIDVEQIDQDLLQVIDRNTLNSLYDEKVLIYQDTKLIYSSIDDTRISDVPELLTLAKENREYRTTQGSLEVEAMYMAEKVGNYTILASAFDRYGRSKMAFLKLVMIAVYCLGLLVGWVVIFFFVRKNIQPLEKLKSKLQNTNYNNLESRLQETGQGEEVNSLAVTFNQMLARLQQSFNFQKDFIHYASHELRTPLAAMIGLTENSLQKKLTAEEAKIILKELFQQQQNLADITNSLLVLSDERNGFGELEYPPTRLDELVFKAVEIAKNIYPDAKIEVNLEGDLTHENSLMMHANEPLMLMAINNLLKNAIQYSPDRKARIIVSSLPGAREIRFLNAGSAFSEEERDKIFTPFYRASNAGAVKGFGLGLSLVKQIIQLHKASITYSYKDGFNEFRIVFPGESPV